MIVFGGNNIQKQTSRVDSCTLKRIGTLGFSFNIGACTTTPNDEIYLCFDSKLINGCRVGLEPTGQFEETERGFFSHYNTRIAASSTEILAVGQFRGEFNHANVEKIETKHRIWKPLLDYPYADSISQAPILYHVDSFYVFGGYDRTNNKLVSAIARFTVSSGKWSKPGELTTKRRNHGAILIDGSFIVIGGLNDNPTERCTTGEKVKCVDQEPLLNNYYSYPELFLVNSNYCPE